MISLILIKSCRIESKRCPFPAQRNSIRSLFRKSRRFASSTNIYRFIQSCMQFQTTLFVKHDHRKFVFTFRTFLELKIMEKINTFSRPIVFIVIQSLAVMAKLTNFISKLIFVFYRCRARIRQSPSRTPVRWPINPGEKRKNTARWASLLNRSHS